METLGLIQKGCLKEISAMNTEEIKKRIKKFEKKSKKFCSKEQFTDSEI